MSDFYDAFDAILSPIRYDTSCELALSSKAFELCVTTYIIFEILHINKRAIVEESSKCPPVEASSISTALRMGKQTRPSSGPNKPFASFSLCKYLSFSFASSPKNSYSQDDINHLLRLHLENDSTLNALEELTFCRLIPIHWGDVLISRHATGDVFRVSPRFTFECEPVEAERLRVFD